MLMIYLIMGRLCQTLIEKAIITIMYVTMNTYKQKMIVRQLDILELIIVILIEFKVC